MEQKLIPVLLEFYPDFFKENVERLKISDETKNMIRQKLSLQTPEEPTIASLNIIVKIAKTLDLKKKYILADKLTKILGKYNV
jgi:ribosomal protein S24E